MVGKQGAHGFKGGCGRGEAAADCAWELGGCFWKLDLGEAVLQGNRGRGEGDWKQDGYGFELKDRGKLHMHVRLRHMLAEFSSLYTRAGTWAIDWIR